MMPGWFRGRRRAWVRLAAMLARAVLLWLLAASLVTNAANVLHLRIALDPAQRHWASIGDRLYQVAALLGASEREMAFQRGTLAWRVDQAEQALDLWQASATAADMEEFIRAQLLTGDVVSLCVALEHREALWPRACEPCFVAYVRSGRDEDVLRLFEYLAVDDPFSPALTPERQRALAWIYFDAGKAYYSQKAFPAAMAKFQVAQSLFEAVPPAPEALYRMIGTLWLAEGDLDQAEAYLARAPNDPDAMLSLAELYTRRQDWDSAIKTSDWGVTRWPTSPTFYRKRAAVYAAMGQDQMAFEANAEAERLQRESTPNAQ